MYKLPNLCLKSHFFRRSRAEVLSRRHRKAESLTRSPREIHRPSILRAQQLRVRRISLDFTVVTNDMPRIIHVSCTLFTQDARVEVRSRRFVYRCTRFVYRPMGVPLSAAEVGKFVALLHSDWRIVCIGSRRESLCPRRQNACNYPREAIASAASSK